MIRLTLILLFGISVAAAIQVKTSFADSVNVEPISNNIITTGPCAYKLSISTSASAEIIWNLWADVENWKEFDTLLEYSFLKDQTSFELGAVGYVKARGAPKTKFEIIEFDAGKSFTESLKLPAWHTLELKRLVHVSEGKTVFTHEIVFKGPFKGVLYYFLADNFKRELPLVMTRLKLVAESK